MACSARLLGDVNVSFDLSSVVPAGPVRIDVDYDRTVEHVVIVGNGIAGNTAADHVRRRHPHCTIDIVGEELHPVYNRMIGDWPDAAETIDAVASGRPV